MKREGILKHLPWMLLGILGASCLGVIALRRGESISALWIIVASVAVYLVAYRYYSLYIATKVMQLDATRATPAVVNNDGLNYVPTNKNVLFGHHFAAIAGAGPLVGPVLAAQVGYLPGTLWLLGGVVLAGAVQDFMVLFISSRRNGASLGEIIKKEMGPIPGTIALFGCFLIMIIILAVLALIVVKALAESPWGVFTVCSTVPIALFMGVYMRFLRPGKVGEVSIIGIVLLIASIWFGGVIAHDPYWGPALTFKDTTITYTLIGYAFVSALLPVWLILAPRDYLATFLKIGVIVGLAIGIVILNPELKMPAVTQFVDGTGPVWKGTLFPFLFITIACGAISGFHALVSSGTTPKLVERESHIRFIGYGGMLMESFVAIMALICASVIDPGVYFAMNSPAALIGTTVESASQAINSWGFMVTPETLTQIAHDVGEKSVLSRAGGAPTFAVGMAHIISEVFNSRAMMAFWYHFDILFEALFIITAVDAGTRACRFMVQDLVGVAIPRLANNRSWFGNLAGTTVAVAGWGFFVYQGVVDPLGGINTLWPLFGIGNQMLASMALILGTVVLFKMKKQRYAWVTILPTIWLFITSMTAGWQKIFHEKPSIGFLAQAKKFSAGIESNTVIAPAKSIADMQTIVFANQINAALCAFFMLVAVTMLVSAFFVVRRALSSKTPTVRESTIVLREETGRI